MFFPGSARLLFSPRPGRAFFAIHCPRYFAMSALFFSSIIMWPLPRRPAASISTYSVFTPASFSQRARQWS
jgi:hypothetical protein